MEQERTEGLAGAAKCRMLFSVFCIMCTVVGRFLARHLGTGCPLELGIVSDCAFPTL
jgi:hypothetical protein